jgi:hypothetical protein
MPVTVLHRRYVHSDLLPATLLLRQDPPVFAADKDKDVEQKAEATPIVTAFLAQARRNGRERRVSTLQTHA